MKRQKNNLDERQELDALKIERRGLMLMYLGLTVSIMVQIFLYEQNVLRYVAGETIVLCIGGIYSVAASLRKGIWDRRLAASAKSNLDVSFIISGIFALIFGIFSYVRFGMGKVALESALIFFVSMFLVCYAVLMGMLIVYKRNQKKMDETEEAEETEDQ